MYNYTQGDPALHIHADGSDLVFKNGQPVMDQGLHNAALISLFTSHGWWGNDLFADVNKKIGSRFEQTANEAITVSAIQRIRAAAERAFKWMLDSGLAGRVSAIVRNPSSNRLDVGVLIEPPSRDPIVLAAKRHGANWIAQRDYPAHDRLGI